jgi:hypothetical protein
LLEAACRYAEHLSDADLALLGAAVDLPADRAPGELRARPDLLETAVADPATYERLFGAGPEVLVRVSPFLVFAAAVHRAVDELQRTSWIDERVGDRLRVPVFDVASLRDFGDAAERRVFTAELLASYTTVVSGPVWVRRGGRWRRQRFSELDPGRLAALAVAVPEADRPGLYRRLGDLALFLTGVFPDHVAHQGVAPLERQRLLRSLDPARPPSPDDVTALSGPAGPLLAWLGPRWYRQAARATPLGSVRGLLADIAGRFDEARRFLNVVTDRFLFPLRGQVFPAPGG